MSPLAFQQKNIEKAIHCGVPFAMWSLPGDDRIQQLFCEPSQLIKTYSLNQLDRNKGFVFAPFQICKHLPIYIIPFDNSIEWEAYECKSARKKILSKNQSGAFDMEKSKKEHIRQVNLFLEAFKQTGMQKAVLTRSKWLSNFSLEQMPFLFEKLQQFFPDAFVYQIFIPEVGYWMGATPELLYSGHNGQGATVSLAGTQPLKNIKEVVWDHKEMIEQELVTGHIREVLKAFSISNHTEQGPETSIAGNIVHIKTMLEFNKANIDGKIGQFIDKLHPTPAVCGLPVKDSLELILETEGYDREYYSGFLGPFDPSENTDLFVNLRCLQAFDNGVLLYAGGGITPESDPEKEWEETRIKIQTLEQILEKIYP